MSGVMLSSQLKFPDPREDWANRQPLLWEFTQKPSCSDIVSLNHVLINEIRESVVLENFKTREPTTYLLGPVECVDRTPVTSLLHVFKAAMKETYKLGILHTTKNTIEVVAIVAFGTLALGTLYIFFTGSRKMIKESAKKLKEGNHFWYRSDDFARKFPIRKYDASDHRSAIYTAIFSFCLIGIPSSIFISLFALIPLNKQETDKRSLSNVFLRLKQLNTKKYAIVQRLKRQSSPLSQVNLSLLRNKKQEEGYLDPISQNLIPSSSIRLPSTLKIGNLAFCIQTLLPIIFTNDLEKGVIHHPTEDRLMTSEEQKEFLTGVSTLFSMSKEEILDCWKIKDETIPNEIPDSLKGGAKDVCSLRRIKKFLDKVPYQVIQEHFKSSDNAYPMKIYSEYPSWIPSLNDY